MNALRARTTRVAESVSVPSHINAQAKSTALSIAG
jgi:hypothetical protein